MFFDEVTLTLEGGRGGNGMVFFHREKYVDMGPPDGGEGGNGGDVILVADENHNTFRHFSGRKSFTAGPGENGNTNNRAGHAGENLELLVPVGTLVYDVQREELLADLRKHGDRFLISKGGRGGYGNAHFMSSTRQAPKFAELGDIGESREVRLELRLVADVGLLGFPSAGKSTFISHVSAAKPKVGAYPFTTLIPNLGVVYLKEFGGNESQSLVIADMPGIIEGASEGKGLGGTFLKHIARSATLLYLLDPFPYEERTLSDQFRILQMELKKYDPKMVKKEFLVAINKIDAIPEEDRARLTKEFLKDFPKLKNKLRLVSGVSGEGLSGLLFELWTLNQKAEKAAPEVEATSGIQSYTPVHFVDEQSFEVKKMYELHVDELREVVYGVVLSEGTRPRRTLFEVTGPRIQQISRMTNVDQEQAIQRLYDVLQKMGIQTELRRQGAETGDFIKIAPHFFEFHDLQ